MLAFSKISTLEKLTQFPSVCALIRNFHKNSKSIPVAWEKPKLGWTKLNFDGSCKGQQDKASIGGLFRNHKAEFILGYAESIGRANSVTAELAALRRGLELVVQNGWSHVWLEGDAKALLHIIANRKEVRCVEARMHVSEIRLIIPEVRNCVLTHTYREGNRAADKFAQMGHFCEKPRVWEDVPPSEVLSIMHEDAEGKVIFRRIR